MNKIDIKIKDNKDYGDVAFLVDKSIFLTAIADIRKRWNIKYLLPVNKFKDWQQKLYDKDTKILEDFEIDIRDLRIRFNKSETFDKVISYAVICGAIPEGIYKSTYWRVVLDTPTPLRLQDRTSRVAIFITPQSQLKQIKEAYRDIKKNYFKRDDGYEAFFNTYNKDEVQNIKRDREWYWRNKNGESYLQIALKNTKLESAFKEAQKADKHRGDYSDSEWRKYHNCLEYVEDYEDMVRKAIERYKKALLDT